MSSQNDFNDTIDQLYCIRAGMSMLSKEADKAIEVEEKYKKPIAEIDKNIEMQEGIIKNYNRDIKIKEDSFIRETKSLEEKDKEYARKAAAKKESDRQGAFCCSGCSLILAIGALILFLCAIFDFDNLVLTIIGAVFFAIFSFISIISFRESRGNKKNQNSNKDIERQQYLCKTISTLSSLRKKKDIEIGRIKNNIDACNVNISRLKSQKEDLLKEQNAQIKEIRNNARVIYDDLVSSFSVVLDPRDWKIVDFVIFMIETGRADSIKEALIFSDQQVRNDKLIEVVRQSSESIQSSISQQFSRIKMAIDSAAQKIEERYVQNNNLLEKAVENSKKLSIATEMQNALMEKIETSSSTMASNIERLKLHDDIRFMKSE